MPERDLEFFVGLELRVWDALARGDPAADRELLSADFVGLYPTGFADRSEHAGQLEAGATVASYAIADARLIVLSPSAVMLCYRADYCRAQGGLTGENEAMYVSSLWVERDDRWQNLFSQDTPASPER